MSHDVSNFPYLSDLKFSKWLKARLTTGKYNGKRWLSSQRAWPAIVMSLFIESIAFSSLSKNRGHISYHRDCQSSAMRFAPTAITRVVHLTHRWPIRAAHSSAAILRDAALASESRGSPWLPQCAPRLSTLRLIGDWRCSLCSKHSDLSDPKG